MLSSLLKGLRRVLKAKEPEVELDGMTFWEVTPEALDETAREPGVLVELLGLETDTNGDRWWTYEATARGDTKRLACKG